MADEVVYAPSKKLSIDTTSIRALSQPSSAPLRGKKREQFNPMHPETSGPFFKPTHQFANLYSSTGQMLTVSLTPKMDRGFFLSGSDWTCYRRNYFQVSCAFTFAPEDPNHYDIVTMEIDGVQSNISQFLVGISSKVASGDKIIELVQHTPKRDKGPQSVPEPRQIVPGGNPHHYSGANTTSNVATFERLQFKSATANNGKRRAAQQYYCVIVDLFATTESGLTFKVATTESAPLVVRGRSPGHYTDAPPAPESLQFQMMQNKMQFNDSFSPLNSSYSSLQSPVTYSPAGPMLSPAPYSALPFVHDTSYSEDARFNSGQWMRSRHPSSQSVSSFLTNESYNSSYDSNDFSHLQSPVTEHYYRNETLQSPLTPTWNGNYPATASEDTAVSLPQPSFSHWVMDVNHNGNLTPSTELTSFLSGMQFDERPHRTLEFHPPILQDEITKEDAGDRPVGQAEPPSPEN
ncbi:hypothetical protein EDD86DRAFT_202734 [Gorgonomyces haynaldii]|nr:hypothetical protein EDD86DRAFT_202734 [Gorgonomyces haynaldii]